jgi:nucleoid-associated protein YgaU
MAGLLERLGSLFGHHTEAPAAEAPPAEAPPAEEAPVEVAPVEVAPVEVAEASPSEVTATAQDDTASASVDTAAPVEAAAAPAVEEEPYIPVSQRAWNQPVADTYTKPVVVPLAERVVDAPVAEAPPAPVKSAEEELEERLWADVEAAWSNQDFQKVTESLDALKALEPEDAVAIDEKIAAAQFNHATQLEQSGDLQRALFLFQDAQRRNPNLGEAVFAIERVQNALAPAPAQDAPIESAPAERTYTVEAGDTLWAISERFYGSGNEWSRIFEANTDQVANPDAIQPGQTLRIP